MNNHKSYSLVVYNLNCAFFDLETVGGLGFSEATNIFKSIEVVSVDPERIVHTLPEPKSSIACGFQSVRSIVYLSQSWCQRQLSTNISVVKCHSRPICLAVPSFGGGAGGMWHFFRGIRRSGCGGRFPNGSS
jgi:hypothetical protein